jgi:hypothetical protein
MRSDVRRANEAKKNVTGEDAQQEVHSSAHGGR